MTVRFLDPVAGPPHVTEKYDLAMSGTETAPRLGLVANGFPDSVAFLDELQAAISESLPSATFVRYTKPQLGIPFDDAEARERFGGCTAMVMAWGHCGTCTATTVRDATTFARSGLPVVVLLTEAFLELADMVSTSLGITGLPLVVLPHPTAGTGRDSLRAISAASSPEVLQRLRGAA